MTHIIEKHFLEIFCSEVFPKLVELKKKNTLENAIYKPLSKMISETVTYDPFPPHPNTKKMKRQRRTPSTPKITFKTTSCDP